MYEAVLDLHRMDGTPWANLTEYAGYNGPASLKNIVQQRSHDLEFARGLRLMRMVSMNHKNKRLHKHCIDTNKEMIVDRPKMERATGDMLEETFYAMDNLVSISNAVRMGDHKTMEQSYYDLQNYLCRLREEIDCARSILAKEVEA